MSPPGPRPRASPGRGGGRRQLRACAARVSSALAPRRPQASSHRSRILGSLHHKQKISKRRHAGGRLRLRYPNKDLIRGEGGGITMHWRFVCVVCAGSPSTQTSSRPVIHATASATASAKRPPSHAIAHAQSISPPNARRFRSCRVSGCRSARHCGPSGSSSIANVYCWAQSGRKWNP